MYIRIHSRRDQKHPQNNKHVFEGTANIAAKQISLWLSVGITSLASIYNNNIKSFSIEQLFARYFNQKVQTSTMDIFK